MDFWSYKNFAVTTVSTGYDASSTAIVLASGGGSKFPETPPYYLVWWNSSDYSDPADDPNKEIVKVTSRSTDTIIVIRGQQGVAASTKNSGGKTYSIAQLLTESDWNDSVRFFNEPEQFVYSFDDFIGTSLGNLGLQTGGSGSSLTTIPSEANHPGIVRLFSGNSGSSSVKLATSNRSISITNCYLESVFYIRPITVTGIRLFAGLDDSVLSNNTNKNNGVYFISDPAVYANENWRFIVRNNSSTTETLDTGIVVSANKWYKLQLKSFDAIYIDIYINDNYVGRVSSGLPIYPNLLNCNATCAENSSTGSVDVDAIEILIKLKNRR